MKFKYKVGDITYKEFRMLKELDKYDRLDNIRIKITIEANLNGLRYFEG